MYRVIVELILKIKTLCFVTLWCGVFKIVQQ